MSEFKVGDKGYFLDVNQYTIRPDAVVKKPRIKECTVSAALIIEDGFFYIVDNHFYVDKDWLFKTKQECIDAFKKRLDEL